MSYQRMSNEFRASYKLIAAELNVLSARAAYFKADEIVNRLFHRIEELEMKKCLLETCAESTQGDIEYLYAQCKKYVTYFDKRRNLMAVFYSSYSKSSRRSKRFLRRSSRIANKTKSSST